MTAQLFSPIKVGQLELKHRVVMAPLTRMRAPNNVVQKEHIEYYKQRASRPGTLIITEATFISPEASGYPLAPGIFSTEQRDAWKPVFEAIHSQGSRVYVQLWALGRAAFKADLESRGLPFVSASNVPEPNNNPGSPAPRPLTVEEIDQYVENYVKAARLAIEAGADGVEIHAANGYLLDQFFHENTNLRTDQYGGSIENRARFALRVVDAISEAIGADRVGIRLAPWNIFNSMEKTPLTLAQFAYIAGELQTRANNGKTLSYIHVVEPRWAVVKDVNDVLEVEGSNEFFRSIWKGVLIRSGGYKVDLAKEHTEKDPKTLIAMGRYFIANPDLVNRLERGIELNPYDRSTFYDYKTRDQGYTDYPFAT